MKPKNLFNKRLLIVSIIIYLVFACIIVQSVYVFRNLYRDAENNYIEDIQQEINQSLQTEHWKADLDKLVEDTAIEIIVRAESGERLYSTIDLADDAKIKGIVNDNAKFLESFEGFCLVCHLPSSICSGIAKFHFQVQYTDSSDLHCFSFDHHLAAAETLNASIPNIDIFRSGRTERIGRRFAFRKRRPIKRAAEQFLLEAETYAS